MYRMTAPRRLGGLGATGILISLLTAIGAHHVAGGAWPSLNTGAALGGLNVIMWVIARKAPSRLGAFLLLMLGAQFLDHATMSIAPPSGGMCGHEQTRCVMPAPMTMNMHAMALAHIMATALSVWMAHLVMRLVRRLNEFFAHLLTRTVIKTPVLLAVRATVLVSQTVRSIHHVIRAPRRGPPPRLAFCA